MNTSYNRVLSHGGATAHFRHQQEPLAGTGLLDPYNLKGAVVHHYPNPLYPLSVISIIRYTNLLLPTFSRSFNRVIV